MPRKDMMLPKIVTGVYFNNNYAEEAIKRLLGAGFARENLMVLGGDQDEMRQVTYPLIAKGPDPIILWSCAIGAAVGAISAWIAISYIPGFEFFLSIVPLLSMIAGAAAGSYVGFLLGSFITFDKPNYVSSVQTADHMNGSVLISAKVDSAGDRFKAEAIMEEAGAVEVLVEQPHGDEFTALYHPTFSEHNAAMQTPVEPGYQSEPVKRPESLLRADTSMKADRDMELRNRLPSERQWNDPHNKPADESKESW